MVAKCTCEKSPLTDYDRTTAGCGLAHSLPHSHMHMVCVCVSLAVALKDSCLCD